MSSLRYCVINVIKNFMARKVMNGIYKVRGDVKMVKFIGSVE